MKYIFKIIRFIIFIVLIILLINQYNMNTKVKTYIGEYYYNTINHLNDKARMIKVYISEIERHDTNLLYMIKGELQEYEIELYNIPQKIPHTSKYYSYLLMALKGDINILLDSKTNSTWMDSEGIEKRIIKTCNKIEWSIQIIKNNSEQYKNKYGYYKELYYVRSKTHNIIDKELEKFLKEELNIYVN